MPTVQIINKSDENRTLRKHAVESSPYDANVSAFNTSVLLPVWLDVLQTGMFCQGDGKGAYEAYRIRSHCYFDTSIIPNEATIISATLRLTLATWPGISREIGEVRAIDNISWEPVGGKITGDIPANQPSLTPFVLPLNTLGLASINKSGNTFIVFGTPNEFAGEIFTVPFYAYGPYMFSGRDINPIDRRPRLEVTYEEGAPPVGPKSSMFGSINALGRRLIA